MSEEEKKAIERAKEILKEWQEIVDIEDDTEREIEMTLYAEDMPFNVLKTLVNLVEQLEKENERLENQVEYDKTHIFTPQTIYLNFVPKSKIKDKLDMLKREFDFYAGREHAEWQDGEFDGDVCDEIALKIGILKELLGEEK